MAKAVEVKGYIAGGIEFERADVAMAKAWYQEQNPESKARGRIADQVLIDWFNAGQPQYDVTVTPEQIKVPEAYKFAVGDRRVYSAWLEDQGLDNTFDNRKVWFDQGKPVPANYTPAEQVAAKPDDVMAVIYGHVLDSDGATTEETKEFSITRKMIQDSRGVTKGRITAEQVITAANDSNLLDDVAPFKMVRGETTYHYNNGDWQSSTVSKREIANKLSEAEAENMRLQAETQRLRELLDRAQNDTASETVKPVAKRSPRTKKTAE